MKTSVTPLSKTPPEMPSSLNISIGRPRPKRIPASRLFQGVGNEAKEDAEEALPAADFQMPTDWSPDGRFIAFVNTGFPRLANETQSDVWVFDMAGNRKQVALLKTPFPQ